MGNLAEELIYAGVCGKNQVKDYLGKQERENTQNKRRTEKLYFRSTNQYNGKKQLTPDEQHIVNVLVEKFITPVKINPSSVKIRIQELQQFQQKHQNETKWTEAINGTISSFEKIKYVILIYNPSQKEFEKMLDDKSNKLVRFPNFYYIFHPNE